MGESAAAPTSALSATVLNPDGLHIRPASHIVAALAQFDAQVWLANERTGKPAVLASSPTSLLALAARQGDTVTITASGAQAVDAAAAVLALFEAGFDELDGEPEVRGAISPFAGSGKGEMAPLTAGIGVSPGRAVAPVVRMPEPLAEPPAASVLPESERAAAAARIDDAASSVQSALTERAARVSGEAREILEATALMAADPALLAEARTLVTGQGESPERAVWLAIGASVDLFASLGGRMAERVADLYDVRNRIVCELLGRQAPGVPDRAEPFVLVAVDLAPADTALLDPSVCRALVTVEGGPTSHTAILARSLGLPAIVAAAGAMEIVDGTIVLVDGTTGSIVIDPTDEQIAEASAASEVPDFDGEGRTSDGHRVQLLANVGSPASVADAVAAKAEGVGLFRTEFCFLDRAEAPSIEEQAVEYRRVFAAFPGQKVIVRTLDAGADKPLAFVTDAEEVNPALGIRGYRTAWRRPELLDNQLEAIARAAAAEQAAVGVMAPMIATVDEADDFARRCAAHGLAVSGVMIETPSAALSSAHILEHVDFVSIGTNDLAQYTMAADRLVGELAALNDPWQPAVLRLVAATCDGARASGKPVGVCGEAAADPLLAAVLVGLGASSLSMGARSLAHVAALLGRVTLEQCRAAAELAVAAPSATVARAAVATLLG